MPTWTDANGVTHSGNVVGSPADMGWGDQTQYSPDFSGTGNRTGKDKDPTRVGSGYWGEGTSIFDQQPAGYTPGPYDFSAAFTSTYGNPQPASFGTGVTPNAGKPDVVQDVLNAANPNKVASATATMTGYPDFNTTFNTPNPMGTALVDPYGFSTINPSTGVKPGSLKPDDFLPNAAITTMTPSLPSVAPMPPQRPTDLYPSITPRTTVPNAPLPPARPSMTPGLPEVGSNGGQDLTSGPMGAFMDAMANPSMAASYDPSKDYSGYSSPGFASSSINSSGQVSSLTDQPAAGGWSPSIGGLLGGAAGLAFGGPMGAIAGYGMGSGLQTGVSALGGLLGDAFSGGGGGGGISVSDGNGGFRAADGLDAMSNPDIAGAMFGGGLLSGGGDGGGFSQGGMTGENGGYGNADGSPSSNGPGIW